jgi:hypothetical protein
MEVTELGAQELCRVEIELEAGSPIALGRSPWRNRRVSYIGRGIVQGARLHGIVRPGGGDWSELGQDEAGTALTLVDVRSIWKTHDGAEIFVSYGGRLVIPAGVLADFRDPAKVAALDPRSYYFRIAPLFETSDPRYVWLNGVVAVGFGHRTTTGVTYRVFELT